MNMTFLTQIIRGVFGFSAILAVAYHIVMGLALFLLARQRSMKLAWLAFLPVGQEYVLGAIADDVGGGDRFFRGETCYRHILAVIRIVTLFLRGFSIYTALRGLEIAGLFSATGQWSGYAMEIVSFAVTIVNVYVIAKIYAHYAPGRAPLYALLSVFLGFLKPIFLFLFYHNVKKGRGFRR